MKSRFIVLFIFFLLILGCKQKPPIQLNIVYQSQQCSINNKTNKILNGAEELELVKQGSQLITRSNQDIKNSKYPENILILVSAGRQSTGGYHYELVNNEVLYYKNSNAILLPLKFNQPSLNSFVPQVFTSPCVVVELSKKPKGIDIKSLKIQLIN